MGTRLLSSEPPDTARACFESCTHCLAMCAGHTGACLVCEIMGWDLQCGTAQPRSQSSPSSRARLVPPCPSLVLDLMA